MHVFTHNHWSLHILYIEHIKYGKHGVLVLFYIWCEVVDNLQSFVKKFKGLSCKLSIVSLLNDMSAVIL